MKPHNDPAPSTPQVQVHADTEEIIQLIKTTELRDAEDTFDADRRGFERKMEADWKALQRRNDDYTQAFRASRLGLYAANVALTRERETLEKRAAAVWKREERAKELLKTAEVPRVKEALLEARGRILSIERERPMKRRKATSNNGRGL